MSRIVTISFVLGLFFAASCGVQPAPSTAPAPGAAPTADFPRSGGASRDAAEAMTVGAQVEGVVDPDAELFYSFSVNEGDEISFTFYTEGIWDGRTGMNMRFNVLDEEGGSLTGKTTATYATTATSDMSRDELTYKAKSSGLRFLQVVCSRCKAAAHYKILAN